MHNLDGHTMIVALSNWHKMVCYTLTHSPTTIILITGCITGANTSIVLIIKLFCCCNNGCSLLLFGDNTLIALKSTCSYDDDSYIMMNACFFIYYSKGGSLTFAV